MPRKRRDAIRAAENLVARGRLEAAVREYEKVLRTDAKDTSTLNRLGDLYVRLERLDEATELFRRAADHFSREGFYVKAIAIFKKIIRLDPTRIDVYETLADLYHRQGLTNEARTQYQVVADYYAQNDDVPKVVAINERMVELEPDHPTLRVRLAELYRDLGKLSEATGQYREIATFMMAHDKVDEAVKVYQRAVDLDPEDTAYLTDALLQLKDEGYPEAARDLLRHAETRNPATARLGVLTGLVERPAKSAPPAPAAEPPPREETGGPEEPGREALEASAAPEEGEGMEVPEAEEPPEAAASGESAVGGEGEPESSEPPAESAVFLDLEDAGDLPYAVRREEPGEVEIEIDLEELEPPPTEDLEARKAVETPAERDSAPARQARPEPEPAADPTLARAGELFHEARVLANYGLEDKAAELLAQALELAPEHLPAVALAARVQAQLDRPEEAAQLAESAAELADRLKERQTWEELAQFLKGEGYQVRGRKVLPPATDEPQLQELGEPEPMPEATAVEASPELETDADERLDWLEESGDSAGTADAEELFEEEAEFFDLAGELEEELRREDLLDEEFEPQPAEQSLEEIVEGFRKGVAETLSAEDYDTHYNLGIAYREMGLVDEAIGEFQLAAKDPRYLVDCCSLLGACFLEKGFPDLAVKWHERGLSSPHISEKETLGLLYELGSLYAATGETEAALETFTEIYGTNSNYRDVVARLAELRGGE